jgi:hypothetical protein
MEHSPASGLKLGKKEYKKINKQLDIPKAVQFINRAIFFASVPSDNTLYKLITENLLNAKTYLGEIVANEPSEQAERQ